MKEKQTARTVRIHNLLSKHVCGSESRLVLEIVECLLHMYGAI